jgi:hypothetical protein
MRPERSIRPLVWPASARSAHWPWRSRDTRAIPVWVHCTASQGCTLHRMSDSLACLIRLLYSSRSIARRLSRRNTGGTGEALLQRPALIL